MRLVKFRLDPHRRFEMPDGEIRPPGVQIDRGQVVMRQE